MENMEITFNEYLIERLYEIDSIKETTTQIQSIDYTQSGTQMLIASKDYIVIYDIENFIKLEDFSCQFQGVSFALFSCNSECIVFSGSLDNSINILNRQTKNITHTLYGHKKNIGKMCINYKQNILLSTDDNNETIIWDLNKNEAICMFKLSLCGTFDYHGLVIANVNIIPLNHNDDNNNKSLLNDEDDDDESIDELFDDKGVDEINHSSSNNNNKNIPSMNDSCICLYTIIHDHNNKKIGKCFKKLNVIKGEITKVQFTNTNKYLICLQYNSISVYDIESSLIINIIKSKQNISYKTFDLSPDSQYIGIACNNGMAIFTKIAEHSKEIKRYNHLNQCNCIKFNPVYAVITTADDIVVMMEPDFDNKRQLITN